MTGHNRTIGTDLLHSCSQEVQVRVADRPAPGGLLCLPVHATAGLAGPGTSQMDPAPSAVVT